MKEEWKDVIGFETRYQVSNFGRVRSKDRIIITPTGKSRFYSGKILKTRINTDRWNYVYVTFRHEGSNITIGKSVHRLVAEAFIPNPDNLPEVNHINEISFDNVVSNLEWCTAKYNSNYGKHNKNISKALKKSIKQYSRAGELIKEWDSQSNAANELNIKQGNISTCAIYNSTHSNKRSVGGFIWEF